jgi:hypothetical protein
VIWACLPVFSEADPSETLASYDSICGKARTIGAMVVPVLN